MRKRGESVATHIPDLSTAERELEPRAEPKMSGSDGEKKDGPTGGSASGSGVAPTFEVEKPRRGSASPFVKNMMDDLEERSQGDAGAALRSLEGVPLGSPQPTQWGPGERPAAGSSPLDLELMQEVRSTRGRQPMSVEIVRDAKLLRNSETIGDAMVVYCDLATAPILTAAFSSGAKEARVFPNVGQVEDYATEHFRFHTQRVVGGAIPPTEVDSTDRTPLSREEVEETTAALSEAEAALGTAREESEKLQRVGSAMGKSFATPSASLGRLLNPAKSTKALKTKQEEAAAALSEAQERHDVLRMMLETGSKPRPPLGDEIRKGWRPAVATEYHAAMANRVLLFADGGALTAYTPVL